MASGVISGIIYRKLELGKIIQIPGLVGSICYSTLGRLLDSPPPSDLQKPLGATLEVQRQQQVEILEQQMAWAHLQQRRPHVGNPFGLGLFRNRNNENLDQQQNFNEARAPAPAPPASEEQVQQLVEMGFQRERVMRALQQTDNDLTMATNVLLHES